VPRLALDAQAMEPFPDVAVELEVGDHLVQIRVAPPPRGQLLHALPDLLP
jgi:hypothetical protein